MLKTLEDISSTKKRLKIEIPADSIEAAIRKGLADAQRKAKFPGFRPGKAPMALVEKKFSKDVEAEVLEKIIPEYYLKAVKEADLKPVSEPSIEESFDFKRNSDLSMTLTVEVRPAIENFAYEHIPVKDIPVAVTDEEVDTVVRTLAEERATYETSEDPIQTGDLVTIDYTVKEDNAVFRDTVLKVGSGPYPKAFFDGLQGRRKDEEFDVEATFPGEVQSPYAGKTLACSIKVREVKKRILPALDEEFAKDLGLESMDQVKERVRQNILNAKNRDADSAKQRQILDRLLETYQFEVPKSMLDRELGGIIGEIRAAGKNAPENARSDEALEEEFKPAAEKNVKAKLLLEMIGEREKITVSEDEIKGEIIAMAQRFHLTPENIIKYYVTRDGSLEGLRHSLFERKVLALLLSKATVEKEAEEENR